MVLALPWQVQKGIRMPGLDTRNGAIEDRNGTSAGYYLRRFADPAIDNRFVPTPPGENGNDLPILLTDQDQITTVTATQEAIAVVVTGEDGAQVEAFTVQR